MNARPTTSGISLSETECAPFFRRSRTTNTSVAAKQTMRAHHGIDGWCSAEGSTPSATQLSAVATTAMPRVSHHTFGSRFTHDLSAADHRCMSNLTWQLR